MSNEINPVAHMAMLKLMKYSLQPITYKYSSLTNEEKKLVTVAELKAIHEEIKKNKEVL